MNESNPEFVPEFDDELAEDDRQYTVNLQAPTNNAEIFTALAKAQLEIKDAEFDAEANITTTRSYRYATLASVLSAVREPLNKNGIAIFQPTFATGEPGVIGISTVLAHTSGQTLIDTLTMPLQKMDPQGIGACRTYMRRYSIMAMTGIAAVDDLDAELITPGPKGYERITADEVEKVLIEANNLFGDDDDKVVARMLKAVFSTSELTVEAVSDLPAGLADIAITKLQNQAKREKGAAKKKPADKE